MTISVLRILINAILIVECMWAVVAEAEGPVDRDTQDRENLQRAVDEAVIAGRNLIALGFPEAAYRHVRRVMQETSDDIDTLSLRYVAAQALLAGLHYAQAAELLRPLVDEQPELKRVRLDYAAVLFTLGRDDESGMLFRDILREPDLSLWMRRYIENYLQRIRERQRFKFDWDVGFWRDDNVNNAPEIRTVEIPLFNNFQFTLDQIPVPAWIVRTGVHLRWRMPLMESMNKFLEVSTSVARNTALGANEYNRTWAKVSAGPRVNYTVENVGFNRYGLLQANLGVERRWRGGNTYASGIWILLSLEQDILRDFRAGMSSRYWLTRYNEAVNNYTQGSSFGLYISRRINSWWLKVHARNSREPPGKYTFGWVSHEKSIQCSTNIGQDWNLSIRVGLGKTRFNGVIPLLLKQRYDETRDIYLTASKRGLTWMGYLPELLLNWSHTSSTIPIYQRTVRKVQLRVRRLF